MASEAEIVLFVDRDFGGLHTHLYESSSDLGKIRLGGIGGNLPGTWNDTVSSFVIRSGKWQFFRNAGFSNSMGDVLGPGNYAVSDDVDVDNDSTSSIRLVGS